MPNWCSNSVVITGPTEEIEKLENFLAENKGKNWFNYFLSTPEELNDTEALSDSTEEKTAELIEKYGYGDWYSWNINNWGVKWNCDVGNWDVSPTDVVGESSIEMSFDSPWSAPIVLYEWIENNTDLSVVAEFHEEGMCFVGYYDDGVSESFDYNDTDSLDDIPEYLVENWGLRDLIEERESMYDEDDEGEDK
jgi:hypothetical protein